MIIKFNYILLAITQSTGEIAQENRAPVITGEPSPCVIQFQSVVGTVAPDRPLVFK